MQMSFFDRFKDKKGRIVEHDINETIVNISFLVIKANIIIFIAPIIHNNRPKFVNITDL